MPKTPPTTGHLSRLYFELAQIGANSAGEKLPWNFDPSCKEELLAIACDMSRYDPRLVDIVVEYLVRSWEDTNPAALRRYYKEMDCPQTVAVIMEFFVTAVTDNEAVYFAQYLTLGLTSVPTQFYFHDLYAIGGKLAKRASEEGLYEYKKWGFLACERPVVNAQNKEASGTFDNIARRNILNRILTEKSEISLNDYLSALKFSISRQQALLDIKAAGLTKKGDAGRSVKWKLAA